MEGDVQHWWHEPTGKGTRTRFSDDLLWLPYVTVEYVNVSGDLAILESQLPFLEDEILKEHEDERYSSPKVCIEMLFCIALRPLRPCNRKVTEAWSTRYPAHGLGRLERWNEHGWQRRQGRKCLAGLVPVLRPYQIRANLQADEG